jgi:Flp pilus assembly protein TadB
VRPTKLNETIVLICAVLCLVLGLFIAPLAANGVPSWVAVLIGLLLVGQWVLMRRQRRVTR